jgi:hypothetical protein
MRFMMMVKGSEESETGVLPTEAELSEMGAFNEQLMNAGALLAGEGLHPSSKGARVRASRGQTTIVDGPFAEAKELVAGFWVIQAKTKEEALDWAKRVPFREGQVEVRPLFEAEDFAMDTAEQPPPPDPAPTKRKPGTTRFLCMLKADRKTEANAPASPELLAEMGGFMQELTEQGAVLQGDGLKPTSFGARVYYDGAKRTIVDGPFAESKEIIAGYALVQMQSLKEAIEMSRRMLDIHMRGTGVDEGECEIRQVYETEEFPVSDEEKPDGWRKQELAMRERLGG